MTDRTAGNQIERGNHQTGADTRNTTAKDTAVATAESNPEQQTDTIPATGTSTTRDRTANQEKDKIEMTREIDTTAERDQLIGETKET